MTLQAWAKTLSDDTITKLERITAEAEKQQETAYETAYEKENPDC